MAEKARLFGDMETLGKIMASKSPREQKRLGRSVRQFDEQIWAHAREEIALRANMAKFHQNELLREELVGSRDLILAEASPVDPVWGIGMAVDNPDVTDELKWGANLLGKTLMRVRASLS